MPLATEQVLTIHEVEPLRRLVTTNVVDFIPGIAAYEVGMAVDIDAMGARTRLVVTLDPMHDQHWTEMAVQGWEGQLEKLARVAAQAAAHATPGAAAGSS